MAEVKIKIRIKRGNKADWETVNPVLSVGEIGWVIDEGKWFTGNGAQTYTQIFAGDLNNVWTSEKEAQTLIESYVDPLVENLQDQIDALTSGTLIALPYDTNHATAFGNGYVVGDIVFYSGNVYRCIANNDAIIPTNATYWVSLGAGFQTVQTPVDWNATTGNNQILNKPSFVEGVTDDGNGVVSIDNTTPTNPIVNFNGVNVDGTTINGDGTSGNPLTVIGVDGVQSVTDNAGGGVSVDNTDPLNPVISFTGVSTDGITMGGDGTLVNPLYSIGADAFTVKASATDVTPTELDSKIACTQDSSLLISAISPSGFQYLDLRVNWSPRIVFECKNTDTVTINRGDPVYLMGMVGATNVFQVGKADASDPAKMPSVGVAENNMLVNGSSAVVASGSFLQFTTDPIDGVTPTPNQTLYVKAGGGLTTVKPTGTNLIQNIGKVGKVSVGGAGSFIVSAIMRTNDLPNIADTKIWIGNASGVPTAQTISGDATLSNTGALTIANDAVTYAKIQNVSATKKLLGRVSAGAGDIEEVELSSDGTLGGVSSSGSIVSSQSAVKNYVDVAVGSKQDTLVSGTNIKTVNSNSLVGSGDVLVQDVLVSGTNIKTINNQSILGSGDLETGYALQVQALTSSPADGATIYFGNLPKAPTTTANISKVYIPRAGNITRAEIYCYSGTAGTNENWSGYIRKNNTTDTLIATLGVNTNERRFSNTSLNIAVVAGDYIEIKFINPTWATNPLTTIFGGYIWIE